MPAKSEAPAPKKEKMQVGQALRRWFACGAPKPSATKKNAAVRPRPPAPPPLWRCAAHHLRARAFARAPSAPRRAPTHPSPAAHPPAPPPSPKPQKKQQQQVADAPAAEAAESKIVDAPAEGLPTAAAPVEEEGGAFTDIAAKPCVPAGLEGVMEWVWEPSSDSSSETASVLEAPAAEEEAAESVEEAEAAAAVTVVEKEEPRNSKLEALNKALAKKNRSSEKAIAIRCHPLAGLKAEFFEGEEGEEAEALSAEKAIAIRCHLLAGLKAEFFEGEEEEEEEEAAAEEAEAAEALPAEKEPAAAEQPEAAAITEEVPDKEQEAEAAAPNGEDGSTPGSATGPGVRAPRTERRPSFLERMSTGVDSFFSELGASVSIRRKAVATEASASAEPASAGTARKPSFKRRMSARFDALADFGARLVETLSDAISPVPKAARTRCAPPAAAVTVAAAPCVAAA